MLSPDQPSAERHRELLSHLPRERLRFLADLYSLEVTDGRKRSSYVEALIAAGIDIRTLLVVLRHDDLKRLARALKIDDPDQEKQALIDAVLPVAPAGSAGVSPAPSQPAAASAPAKRPKKRVPATSRSVRTTPSCCASCGKRPSTCAVLSSPRTTSATCCRSSSCACSKTTIATAAPMFSRCRRKRAERRSARTRRLTTSRFASAEVGLAEDLETASSKSGIVQRVTSAPTPGRRLTRASTRCPAVRSAQRRSNTG